MLQKLLIALAALIVLLVAYVATRPDTFRVERTTRIAAPPDVVFGEVNDLQRWREWSPWEALDPQMKRSYSGPSAGVGASQSWSGNKAVGQGSMRITESRFPEKIGVRMEFVMPWGKSVNPVEFTFKPDGAGTGVSWAMSGTNDFMAKAISAFGDMDAMIGKDFDKGLLSLKAVSEKAAQANAAAAAAAAATPPATMPSVPAPQTPVPPN
jgi:hypothetical protein